VVEEIRIYVEGGGNSKDSRAAVREGFRHFFDQLVEKARTRRVRWQIIACGGRNQAHNDFETALKTHPGAFNMLLVDSEGEVIQDARDHLRARDGWPLNTAANEQCHLMVEMMEAWIIADTDALRKFYGQGFDVGAMPGNPNVEQIRKADIERGLNNATRLTQKGMYRKIQHGPKILAMLDVGRVRRAAFHCNNLFETIDFKITEP
jgi:hypothetical protein